MKQLEALFRKYPEDSFANAIDDEGNNGILLAAAEDAGLDTVKWLEQKGVSIDQRNYYGRIALMDFSLLAFHLYALTLNPRITRRHSTAA